MSTLTLEKPSASQTVSGTPPKMIDKDDVLDITLHKYQLKAYNSQKRITALISGIQGGKTRIGGLWLAKQTALYDAPQQNFIVAAPNYKLMQKSTLPWFLHINKGCGTFNKSRNIFDLNGGGVVFFCSMQDDDSAEGATNVRAIWIDEAGKLRYKSWINLYARSSFLQCPIFITTTPYALNWLYKEVYMPWKQQLRQDIEVIQFRSLDNPYFPKEEYEAQKRNLDPRIFEMKYGGTFQKMAGLVYPDFNDNDNMCDPFKFNKKDYYVCAGVDLGFTNEFAIAIRAIRYDGKYDYQIGEHYQKFQDPVKKTEVLKELQVRYNIEQFFVDSEDPGQISMFQAAGLPACGVKKGPNSVEYGIQLHSSLIRRSIYKVFRGKNPYTIDEYETYHYPESPGNDEDAIKEKPVAIKDHLMDANRYVTMMTQWIYQAAEQESIIVYPKSHLQELQEANKERDWYES